MDNLIKKTVIRLSFDTLVEELTGALVKDGFRLSNITDFQQEFSDKLNVHFRRYKVLGAHLPHISHQMLCLSSVDGIVLPCNITVSEVYPGEVEVVTVNVTGLIAERGQNYPLQNIAAEMSRRIEMVIQTLERKVTLTPDLITSWG